MGVIFSSYNGHLLTAALLERFFGIRSCFHLGLMGSVANTVSGRWAVRQISAGVAPSEQTAKSWREIGWPKKTLQVVPNWIDWEDYSKLPTKKEARSILERDYGFKGLSGGGSIKVVGYVGRLVQEKGIEVLLEAWRGMEEKLPEAVLLIAGSGTHEYEKELKKRAGARVRFLGAVADPKPVYAACDLVVTPSLWEEPFGLIPLEAVACGALPLVSDRGFLPQMVQEVEKGLIHPAGNSEDLARQMDRWLGHSADNLRTRLRNTLEERASSRSGIEAYKKILQETGLP